MKNKILIMALVIALSVVSGCQKTPGYNDEVSIPPTNEVENNNDAENKEDKEEGNKEDNLSELSTIIQQIYEIKTPELALGDMPVDLTDVDSVKYYTGLSDVSKIKDVLASEAMIGSQAYSLVLVKVNQATDSEIVAKEMLNGIDQRKWICVEADDLQVVAQDDLVMLFMVSSELSDTVTSQEIVDAFEEVCGGKLDLQLKAN